MVILVNRFVLYYQGVEDDITLFNYFVLARLFVSYLEKGRPGIDEITTNIYSEPKMF